MTIRYRPQATQDIARIGRMIADNWPPSAEHFLTQVERIVDSLERFPLMGSLSELPELAHFRVRFMTVPQFRNYLIVYLPLTAGVEIVRVIDGRRDLGAMLPDFL